MLRNLLVERFGLVVHRETQNRPLYELVVAKGGPKLREYKVPASAPSKDGQRSVRGKDGLPELTPGAVGVLVLPAGPNTRLSAGGVSLAELLRMLEIQIGRPVIDKTGLTGKYDFDVTWAMKRWTSPSYPAEPTADTFDATEFGPTLLTAFQSQLGLKFEPKDGPVEVLVVDHVSKAPTEN